MDNETGIEAAPTNRTPVHLWIVGIVSLLWNAFGATDYTMTMTRNATYLAAVTPAQTAYFDSFPAWEVALWALGVWGALAGSVLLLMRRRIAVAAFAVSLFGLAGSTLYQFVIAPPPEALRGPTMIVMNLVIWAVAIALLVYARAMRARGMLR